MQITFKNTKLKKIFNEKQKLIIEYGDKAAKKIMMRMGVLKAAANLNQVPKQKPDRCHELSNNRKGTFAVDLIHPYRLIFKPDMDPFPKLDDGGIDLNEVICIQILEVEDYH